MLKVPLASNEAGVYQSCISSLNRWIVYNT